jgi:carboxyl-terminal processing protease
MILQCTAFAATAALVWHAVDSRPAHAQAKRYTPYRKLNVFARVLHYIETRYVDPVKGQRVVYGAVKGMMRTLDRHSRFFTPAEARRVKAAASGVRAGIGVEVDVLQGEVVVVKVYKGGQAARAGITVNDVIVAIDRIPTKGMDKIKARRLLMGKMGSTVRVIVKRAGWPKPKLFVLRRKPVQAPVVAVKWVLPGVGYVRIFAFYAGAANQTRKALRFLTRGGLKALVLDLRRNPGGLMSEALRVADLFVRKGVLLVKKGRKGAKGRRPTEKRWARPRGTFTGFRMAVLVNGRTASAGEVVAAALKDNRRAILVGTRTYGKGAYQEMVELPDGSLLKLTVGRYYRPSGKTIERTGVDVDQQVPSYVNPGIRALWVKNLGPKLPMWAKHDSVLLAALLALQQKRRGPAPPAKGTHATLKAGARRK